MIWFILRAIEDTWRDILFFYCNNNLYFIYIASLLYSKFSLRLQSALHKTTIDKNKNRIKTFHGLGLLLF